MLIKVFAILFMLSGINAYAENDYDHVKKFIIDKYSTKTNVITYPFVKVKNIEFFKATTRGFPQKKWIVYKSKSANNFTLVDTSKDLKTYLDSLKSILYEIQVVDLDSARKLSGRVLLEFSVNQPEIICSEKLRHIDCDLNLGSESDNIRWNKIKD